MLVPSNSWNSVTVISLLGWRNGTKSEISDAIKKRLIAAMARRGDDLAQFTAVRQDVEACSHGSEANTRARSCKIGIIFRQGRRVVEASDARRKAWFMT
jgi:hypothetical protein